MDYRNVKLSVQTTFLGRNGSFKCDGFEFSKDSSNGFDTVSIFPITSQNRTGRCRIEVAEKDINNFIDALVRVART